MEPATVKKSYRSIGITLIALSFLLGGASIVLVLIETRKADAGVPEGTWQGIMIWVLRGLAIISILYGLLLVERSKPK